jgi:hypothetical protein
MSPVTERLGCHSVRPLSVAADAFPHSTAQAVRMLLGLLEQFCTTFDDPIGARFQLLLVARAVHTGRIGRTGGEKENQVEGEKDGTRIHSWAHDVLLRCSSEARAILLPCSNPWRCLG